MPTATQRARAGALLATHGQTYAREAGVGLRDTPQPLYQVLVLARLVEREQYPAFAAGLVRSALDRHIAEDVTARAGV